MNPRHFLLGLMVGGVAALLYSRRSRRNKRQAFRRYSFEMKDDILERLKEIEEITKETYEKIVDSVVISYEESKILTSWEASRIKEELNSAYEQMKKIVHASKETEK